MCSYCYIITSYYVSIGVCWSCLELQIRSHACCCNMYKGALHATHTKHRQMNERTVSMPALCIRLVSFIEVLSTTACESFHGLRKEAASCHEWIDKETDSYTHYKKPNKVLHLPPVQCMVKGPPYFDFPRSIRERICLPPSMSVQTLPHHMTQMETFMTLYLPKYTSANQPGNTKNTELYPPVDVILLNLTLVR